MKEAIHTERLAADIEDTFEELVREISKFGEAAFNRQPFPGSWTAGQTAEHIVICGSGIPDRKTETAGRAYDEKVDALKKLFLNFDLKFKADPSLAPGPGPHNKAAILRKIRKMKTHLTTIATNQDLAMLCQDLKFPNLGFLTRYEWISFIKFHTKRHTRQIVKISQALNNG